MLFSVFWGSELQKNTQLEADECVENKTMHNLWCVWGQRAIAGIIITA